MVAKELRIGNWVKDNKGSFIPVEDITEKGINIEWYHELTCEAWDYDDLYPIPLTPEILHKAGFEKHRDSNEYWNHWVLKNGWCVSEWIWHCPIAGFEEKGVCYWGEEFIPMRYLHSLQNFYFCHTSQELPINL